MKHCPKCGRDYADETLNFCLEDGEWLTAGAAAFDEPATAVLPEGVSSPGKTSSERATQIYTSGDFVSKEIKKHKLGTAVIGIIAVFVLAGFGYGVYQFLIGPTATEPQRTGSNLSTQRLTGDGKAREGEISPDGRFLAYVRTEDGERSIWLKQIQTNSNIEIVKPGELYGFSNLAFSGDGNFIYFSAEPKENEPPSIYRASIIGGSPTKVVSNGFSPQISADGRNMSFVRFDFETNETSVVIADAEGGNERKLASRKGKLFFEGSPAWSPDGKLIAVKLGDDSRPQLNSYGIGLITVSDGTVTELPGEWLPRINDLVWHPDGNSLIVSAIEGPMSQAQLWEFAYPSGDRRRLTNNLNGHNTVSITADGKAIVTGEIYSRSAVWVSPDLDPENAKPIMKDTGDTWGFSWTPDNRIVFVSDQTGDPEIWIMDADGANAKALTSDRIYKAVPVVSPDGRHIVYSSSGTLFRIDINGGNKTEIATSPGSDNPDISPDGKWIIYSTWIEGISRIVRVPFNGGEPQILKDWAIEPRYSRDGTRIACFTPTEQTQFWNRLAIFPADGGEEIKSFRTPPNTNTTRGPIWTPDDKGITVVIAPGEKQELWLQPVDGSPGKQMTDVGLPGIARRDYSRDGKRIAIVRAQGFGNAIMITDFR